MSEIKWEIGGKGLKRVWTYEGIKGTYKIHTQFLMEVIYTYLN
ncbi:Hypothetical protein DAL_40 [Psychrobacter phage D'Alembert]|nr:Hypothetical protein DAL_40 [Psychrobacter phage D'Alembert]